MPFVDDFGLTVDEAIDLRFVAEKAIGSDKAILSRQILNHASPDASERIRVAIVSKWLESFSGAG